MAIDMQPNPQLAFKLGLDGSLRAAPVGFIKHSKKSYHYGFDIAVLGSEALCHAFAAGFGLAPREVAKVHGFGEKVELDGVVISTHIVIVPHYHEANIYQQDNRNLYYFLIDYNNPESLKECEERLIQFAEHRLAFPHYRHPFIVLVALEGVADETLVISSTELEELANKKYCGGIAVVNPFTGKNMDALRYYSLISAAQWDNLIYPALPVGSSYAELDVYLQQLVKVNTYYAAMRDKSQICKILLSLIDKAEDPKTLSMICTRVHNKASLLRFMLREHTRLGFFRAEGDTDYWLAIKSAILQKAQQLHATSPTALPEDFMHLLETGHSAKHHQNRR